MDSTWEVALAKKLDDLKIRWVRDRSLGLEYLTRGRRKRMYIPDFYLPDHDVYIEVKGYWTDSARYKMKSVLEKHDIKLIILESLIAIENVEASLELTSSER
jgi:predicted nuclease of restriction endonuclease-like RecB superfamily